MVTEASNVDAASNASSGKKDHILTTKRPERKAMAKILIVLGILLITMDFVLGMLAGYYSKARPKDGPFLGDEEAVCIFDACMEGSLILHYDKIESIVTTSIRDGELVRKKDKYWFHQYKYEPQLSIIKRDYSIDTESCIDLFAAMGIVDEIDKDTPMETRGKLATLLPSGSGFNVTFQIDSNFTASAKVARKQVLLGRKIAVSERHVVERTDVQSITGTCVISRAF